MKRTHIPGVVDVFEVSDPEEIEAVNNDGRMDRQFNSRTCPFNWLLLQRSLRVLSYEGKRFPTMTARDSMTRKMEQEALWNRLKEKVPAVKLGPEELEPLSDWVRGNGAEESIGPRAQQILGQLFSETFVATPASWDAATTLVKAPHSTNIVKLLWWGISGKVRRAKRQLAGMVNQNLSGVNAIGIAVHNLVNSLRRMKAVYADTSLRGKVPAEEVVRRCLVAPGSIYREATRAGELKGKAFAKDSLFILKIGEGAQREGTGRMVFMRESWSSCPAEQWVPAMLEGVWLRAIRQEIPKSRA